MSRHHYSDDLTDWELIRYRGAVLAAIRGKRGQKLLREMAKALDAMSEKRLIAGALEEDGQYCALGVVGAARGIDLENIDPGDPEEVAKAFDIAKAMAAEIAFINDDCCLFTDSGYERWYEVRAWVANQIKNSAKVID